MSLLFNKKSTQTQVSTKIHASIGLSATPSFTTLSTYKYQQKLHIIKETGQHLVATGKQQQLLVYFALHFPVICAIFMIHIKTITYST